MRHEKAARLLELARMLAASAEGLTLDEMAQAMGVKGIRVEHPSELEAALREAFAHDGPVLVDVVSARQELVMPPTKTFEQAKGFSLFMLKTVMDGRARELIDLAKVNLWR